jgi:hypothetical protein
MAKLPVTLAAPSELVAQLAAIAARLDIQAFTGRIAAVGQFTAEYPYGGWLYVTFADDGGNGGGAYASQWPQWAFNLAQTALVSGRNVFLVANGEPIGDNLIEVWLLE